MDGEKKDLTSLLELSEEITVPQAPETPIIQETPSKEFVLPELTSSIIAPLPEAPPVEPPRAPTKLEEIKEFGEKVAIGQPQFEANPPFTILAYNAENRPFSPSEVQSIENAITEEDYGIQLSEIAIQLKSGKLLIPRISEFAAIHLAMRIRDVVDTIELGPSSEIFESKTLANETDSDAPSFIQKETYRSKTQESWDLKDLPGDPKKI